MNSQNDGNNTGRTPDYIAYNVREAKDGNGYWNKVGAAWRHRDGQGYDLQLDSLPVDGRVALRELREERMQRFEDQQQTQSQHQEPSHQHEQDQNPSPQNPSPQAQDQSRDRSR